MLVQASVCVLCTLVVLIASQQSPPLRIAVKGDSPEFADLVDGSMQGFIVDVLDHVIQTVPLRNPVVVMHNGTWPELVAETATGVWDLAAASLTMTPERSAVLLFTDYVFLSTMSMIVRGPSQAARWSGIYDPFTWRVWLMSLLCLAAVAVVIWLAESPKDRPLRFSGILHGLWFSYMLPFGPPLPPPRTHLARVATVIWKFALLIITSAYTANLAAVLTNQFEVANVRGMEDVVNYPVAATAGGFTEEHTRNSGVREVLAIPAGNVSVGGELVSNGTAVAYVKGTYSLQGFIRRERRCDLQIVGTHYTHPNAFALPTENSKLRDDISAVLIDMRNDGTMDILIERWLENNALQCEKKGYQWNIPTLAGAFVMAAIGAALALIGSCHHLSILMHRKCKPNRKTRKASNELPQSLQRFASVQNLTYVASLGYIGGGDLPPKRTLEFLRVEEKRLIQRINTVHLQLLHLLHPKNMTDVEVKALQDHSKATMSVSDPEKPTNDTTANDPQDNNDRASSSNSNTTHNTANIPQLQNEPISGNTKAESPTVSLSNSVDSAQLLLRGTNSTNHNNRNHNKHSTATTASPPQTPLTPLSERADTYKIPDDTSKQQQQGGGQYHPPFINGGGYPTTDEDSESSAHRSRYGQQQQLSTDGRRRREMFPPPAPPQQQPYTHSTPPSSSTNSSGSATSITHNRPTTHQQPNEDYHHHQQQQRPAAYPAFEGYFRQPSTEDSSSSTSDSTTTKQKHNRVEERGKPTAPPKAESVTTTDDDSPDPPVNSLWQQPDDYSAFVAPPAPPQGILKRGSPVGEVKRRGEGSSGSTSTLTPLATEAVAPPLPAPAVVPTNGIGPRLGKIPYSSTSDSSTATFSPRNKHQWSYGSGTPFV